MDDPTWDRFVAGPTTLGPTPGVREAWHRGRNAYAVWVLRVAEAEVLARMAAVLERLGPHGVRAYGPAHITVYVVGFPAVAPFLDDDVPISRVLAPLRPGLPRPRLYVGGASAFLSCPFLRVSDPHQDLDRLRETLASTGPEIRFAPYVPHVTVGLFSDDRPTGPIAAALAPLRGLPPLPLTPRALELVLLDPRDPSPVLRTVAAIPLE